LNLDHNRLSLKSFLFKIIIYYLASIFNVICYFSEDTLSLKQSVLSNLEFNCILNAHFEYDALMILMQVALLCKKNLKLMNFFLIKTNQEFELCVDAVEAVKVSCIVFKIFFIISV
jgi:hypothetical protein